MNMKTQLIAKDNEAVVIESVLLGETPKAILVLNPDDDEVWLPLSQIEVSDKFKQSNGETEVDKVVVYVPLWLADKKELY